MNPFEKFMNPSKPNANEQMESPLIENYTGLIDSAKTKVEGVLLYAPIPEDVRTKLLSKLEEIEVEDETSLEYFFKTESRGTELEKMAALYVYRRLRGTISASESIIGREEAERLDSAVAHMYTDESEYGNKLHAAWMNKNNNN